MKLIGFGGKLESGKSTAALLVKDIIREHNSDAFVDSLSFAGALKDIAYQMGWDGVKDARGRRLLQCIGTEVGRTYDPDIWVNKLKEKIKIRRANYVIIDDARFHNEITFINNNGISILLTRAHVEADDAISKHASETELTSGKWKYEIRNDYDKLTLKKNIAYILKLENII